MGTLYHDDRPICQIWYANVTANRIYWSNSKIYQKNPEFDLEEFTYKYIEFLCTLESYSLCAYRCTIIDRNYLLCSIYYLLCSLFYLLFGIYNYLLCELFMVQNSNTYLHRILLPSPIYSLLYIYLS